MEIISCSSPTLIQQLLDEEIVQITASGDVSAAVTQSGQVYTWGRTKSGVLGAQEEDQIDAHLSQTTNLVLPTMIEAQGVTFKHVACGKTHVAAVTENGKV